MDPLTDQEAAILATGSQWWRYRGAFEEAVRAKFDLSPTQFHQQLNALLDDPRALAHDPFNVRRLRRLREQRRLSRSVRRLGVQ